MKLSDLKVLKDDHSGARKAIIRTESSDKESGKAVLYLVSDWHKSIPNPDMARRQGKVGDSEGEATRDAIWRSNSLSNFNAYPNANGIKELEGVHKGRQALMILGGSSARDVLRYIKRAKDKGFVTIASASILNEVDENLVDYVVQIDFSPPAYMPWWKKSVRFTHPTLIHAYWAHPAMTYRFKNVRFFSECENYKGLPVHRPLEAGWLDSQLHVGFPMLNFADFIGCNPIYFAGMDCAFLDGMQHFYQKLDMRTVAKTYSCPIQTHPDVNGVQVMTNAMFYGMATIVEVAARLVKDYGVKVINATKKGIVGAIYEDSVIEKIHLKDVLTCY